jgi:hypothetical protein
LTSIDDLRRALAAGDVVRIVPTDGQPMTGRLRRVGDADLDLRLAGDSWKKTGKRDVTVGLETIQSLSRPRDPVGDGTLIGAAVGAGIGGAFFVHALLIDRNEFDEWAGFYAGATGFCVGIGALIGWAVDGTHSRPAMTFTSGVTYRKVNVRPAVSRGRGIAVLVSFSP